MKNSSCLSESMRLKKGLLFILPLLTALFLLAGIRQACAAPAFVPYLDKLKPTVPTESTNSAESETESSTETTPKKSGFVREGSSICYYYTSGKKAVGFLKNGKRWYHFDESGKLSLGWFSSGSSRYYASPTGTFSKSLGALKTGYKKVGGVYYYFSPLNYAGQAGRQVTGWVKYGKYYYYYDAQGSKLTGLQTISGKIYYLTAAKSAKTSGRAKTGWKKLNGHKYYFRKSGGAGVTGSAYQSTTVKINKKKFTFNAEGYVDSGAAVSSGSDRNDAFIEQIGALAHADMEKTGVLASVTTAQAIIESNYGKSSLGARAKNLFGMKADLSGNDWGSTWAGKIYKKKTLEYVNGRYITIRASFRRYPNWAASISDHSAYLTGAKISASGALRYAGIVGEKDYKTAAQIIKNGGYATAPNYISALCSVIERFNLTRFD